MKSFKKIAHVAAVIAISLLSLLPFYVLVQLAFSPSNWKFSKGLYLSTGIYLKNFEDAWKTSNIGNAIKNSLIITVGAVAVVILLSSLAGYSIGRVKSRLNKAILNILLLCMMIPGIINTVPLYTLMLKINGINTYWAMILVCSANSLPFAVFLYSSFVNTLPEDIEEAAVIDGCSRFTAFFRVTFPLLTPVTSAVVIINGLGIWNNYAQAVFFLQSQSKRTIPIAISMFFQQYGARWHLMAAASMIGVAPAVLTFLIFQKYFIKGITAGSVKG